MKKLMMFVLSATLVLSLAACGSNADSTNSPPIGGDPATWGPASGTDAGTTDNVEIPNPLTEQETLDDAAKAAGFSLTLPDSIEGYENRTIYTMDAGGDKMIDVICASDPILGRDPATWGPDYSSDEEHTPTEVTEEVRVRKAPGSEDISGDYNTYENIQTVKIGSADVTLKGNGDLIFVAVWTDGDYTYAVNASAGLSVSEISSLISAIR